MDRRHRFRARSLLPRTRRQLPRLPTSRLRSAAMKPASRKRIASVDALQTSSSLPNTPLVMWCNSSGENVERQRRDKSAAPSAKWFISSQRAAANTSIITPSHRRLRSARSVCLIYETYMPQQKHHHHTEPQSSCWSWIDWRTAPEAQDILELLSARQQRSVRARSRDHLQSNRKTRIGEAAGQR